MIRTRSSPGDAAGRQTRTHTGGGRGRSRIPIAAAAGAVLIATVIVTRWRTGPPAITVLPDNWPAYVRVLAGDGVDGTRDGEPWRARFSDPFGVAAAADGTLFVSDAGASQRIRRVTADGSVASIAGAAEGFADGRGEAARFSTPSGIAVDARGTLYVADAGNHAIRRIDADGAVSTLAGNGTPGDRDGAGAAARFNGPLAVAVSLDGSRVVIADTYNDRLREIGSDGTVRTLAGGGTPGLADGIAGEARFDTPSGIALDAAGTVYVADTGNGLVRTVDRSGNVKTLNTYFPDGVLRPVGIAVETTGAIYISDDRGLIYEAAPSGRVRVLAGNRPGFADGDGADARFRDPRGLAVAGPGRLVVADAGNSLLRSVTARSQLTFRVPPAPAIEPAFDARAWAATPLLWPVPPIAGPHEVAGTMGEARGDENAGRFHAGLDVRVEEGTPVVASRAGVVAHPLSSGSFGSLNEWMRIGPLAYVHMRVGRSTRSRLLADHRFVPAYDEQGAVTRVRVPRGARFQTGDVLGSVNAFNHVHLNVGWSGEEHNPLHFGLPQFSDTVPPTIVPGGIRVYDQHGARLTARARGRLLVSGKLQVAVEAYDQADGNRPSRRLGIYAAGYEVLRPEGNALVSVLSRADTLRFDRMTPDPAAAALVFAPGSGIPFYGRRTTRFHYIVSNTFRSGVAQQAFWDTSSLEPGDYTLRVHVRDIASNVALANRDLLVTVPESSIRQIKVQS